MKVGIQTFNVNNFKNSTAVLRELSSNTIDNCNILLGNRHIYADAIINSKQLCELKSAYKTLLRSLIETYNNNSKSAQQNQKELMCEEIGVMAGTNCKRYLQNKLGDRKRRRSNVTVLDATDFVDERVIVDNSIRLRQTTRQSTQKHTTISNLAKSPNKADSGQTSRIITAGSKKILRSCKPDTELINYTDLKKHCASVEYDAMSFRESDSSDANNSNSKSTMFSEICRNSNVLNNEKNYKNLEVKSFEQEEQKTGEYSDNEDNGEVREKEDEPHQNRFILKAKTDNENEEISFICNNTSSARTPSLMDLNENENLHDASYKTTKKENQCEDLEKSMTFKTHGENYENRDDMNANQYSEKTERNLHDTNLIKYNEITMEMPKTFGSNIGNENDHRSTITSRSSHEEPPPFSVLQQIRYENELSHLRNSVCSDNSSSSDKSCEIPMKNINNENLPISNQSNEFTSAEIEQNQKHILKSTNATMNTSLFNSTKNTQKASNTRVTISPGDEQYHHYNTEENKGCEPKSSPSLILLPINMISPKQDTCNESNMKYESGCTSFQTAGIESDCPKATSSATDAVPNNENYMKKGEEIVDPFNNPKNSINVNVDSVNQKQHGDKENILKINPTTMHQLGEQSSLQVESERETDQANNLHGKLENQQKQNVEDSHENFDKYLTGSSHTKHAVFEPQQQSNDRITHQQHEKDIVDAADKVYTHIEEQYHHQQQQTTTLSATYEQIINSHQRQHQSNQHDQEEQHQQRHEIDVHSHNQLANIEHSMQQQYTSEELYHLQQQEHHQHLHLQHQQHQIQKQEEMQQQQHHSIPRNSQRDHRQQQQHSHLMDFLHPQPHHISNTHSPLHQQQHQIHEVYHDLMMEEFHEEHNTPYKLGLSPSTVKHENQDDGYETSAGDVLTPNSHASSSHSVTPQHHMQHGSVLVTSVAKCEAKHRMQQQSQHNTHVINDRNQNISQDLVTNEPTPNITPRDPYHFIDDDINSATNNNLRNILTPPHSHTRSNLDGGPMNGFMVMQSDPSASTPMSSSNDMYGLPNSSVHHHHSQKTSCVNTDSTTPVSNVDHQQHFTEVSTDIIAQDQDAILNLQTKAVQKRRGRKKKIPEDVLTSALERPNANDVNAIAGFTKTKERKKHDRFNGMSEEEVVKRILPDHLCDNLDIVIIGINPGLFAAYKGHHYAGPGNHFWKCLYLSGLTQEQMNADEDFKLIKYGIGFTNMVQRATKGSADLTRKEIKEGSRILLEKLQRFRPKIAVFNGKLIFEVFSGKKDFNFGRQPECVEGTDTFIWVMPSSSARCAQLPRAADKVPFYAALKKFRDYLNGLIPHIDQSECVFTEERIKQQCELENYKQQPPTPVIVNDTAYQNSIQNPVGYPFDAETNAHGGGEGPGPPPPTDNNVSNSFMMSSLVGPPQQHEKKKRGRPKKIKGQEIIDPVTGNKIQLNSQMMGSNGTDYSNILNLSVVQANNEMPKKKRGRPKKVKPPTNLISQDIAQSTSMLSQKPNIMSIQSLTSDIIQSSPHHHMQGLQTDHQQHVALYSTPPPGQHQRNIYSPTMVSPMASPSINCSYTTNTPPSQPHHDKLGLSNLSNGRELSKPTSSSTDLMQTAQHHQHHPIQDQNFGESPPPSSPNICTVDFEPPTASKASSSIVSDNANSDLSTMHQRLHTNHNQKSRFNSPISGEGTPDHNASEHFQQWLSPQPNHSVHSPAGASTSTMFVNSPQQPSLNYHDQPQQQQIQTMQQQPQQHQEMHPQWPARHQGRYDDLANSPYLLTSQLHQTHSPLNNASHNHQNQHSVSDVARKSLSGLESLVDQIPTISESESIALSSAAAVNAQVAAAAAVENRLQGMQNSSLAESQVSDDYSSLTGSQNLLNASNSSTSSPPNTNQIQQPNTSSNLLSSNFSVSNLAASSTSSNNSSSNNHDTYGLPSNARSLAANPNAYHHPNLMAAAVLAAAAANTPTNLSTPPTAVAAAAATNHHTSMYMDPHAHLTTHVPVNSIYPTAAPSSHHHHHSAVAAHHHHAYSSAQHSAAADYTTNNPYAAATQSNLTTSHTLHMPSPNYPYGYSTASSQSNYSAYPHSHHTNPHHHHGHSHAHHTAHHLAMFDRLKPSDITGYSSGF